MVKISLVIITFNEEQNIERCILSAKDVADEILVVDSLSTDNTREIAEKLGARVIEQPFLGHIQQKNFAASQAMHDSVLSLDADECLSYDLRESIKKVKTNFTQEGYYMNRLTNYCGQWIKHGGWYPDRKLRLWDRRKGEWTGLNPHDKFELYKGDAHAGFLKGDILHFSYYSIEGHKKQAEKFAYISAKGLYDLNKKASALNVIVNPAIKFIKDYIFNAGFLEGKNGFTIARISAWSTYLKYKTLRKLHAEDRP